MMAFAEDRLDALTLGGCVPPGRIMALRDLVTYRAGLVRTRTSLRNRIHVDLLMHGLLLVAQELMT